MMSCQFHHNNQSEEFALKRKKILRTGNRKCETEILLKYITSAAVMDFAIAFLNPLMDSVRSTPTGQAGLTIFGLLGEGDGCCKGTATGLLVCS